MTTLIIILALLAACLMFLWLAVRAFQRPKWEKEITERRKAWFDFRAERLSRIFSRRQKNDIEYKRQRDLIYSGQDEQERLKKYDKFKSKMFPWLKR